MWWWKSPSTDGEILAQRTLNGRLGIIGGLSILGTTGIVVPFSCSAWIHSIHRGIDVARASGVTHLAGTTGNSSEKAVRALHDMPETALIEMGDFVGGMLKYLKSHPVPRVTIAGGVAKMTKLAQGRLDLHSKRGEVDFSVLAALAGAVGCSAAVAAEIRRPIPPPKPSSWRARKGRGWAMPSPRKRGKPQRRCWRAPEPSWRSWCSTAQARWSAARRLRRSRLMRGTASCNRGYRARSRGNPPAPALCPPGSKRSAPPPAPPSGRKYRQACPAAFAHPASSTRTITATGQSAP